ncbi:MAG: hypothetical protein R3321_14180 [Nitrososphaeraceae archaeon]|nr:hypothetical protein [Nitrososphaeraceae archaeon]
MPLYNLESINENISLGVWKITESVSELGLSVNLSEADKHLFDQISHPVKQLEFLAGRALIGIIAQRLGISYRGVFRNKYGKPELIDSNFQISLSHTADYVTVLIGKNRNVGLDIEKPQEKMRRVAPRLFNELELNICADKLERISKMWSSKEVLFKLYMKGGIDFKENLFIYDVNEDFSECKGMVKKDGVEFVYSISFKALDDYFICYNIDDPN